MGYEPKFGFWLTDASTPALELVASSGFDFVLFDVEHGIFGLETLERLIPLAHGLGLTVFTKVLGPQREPIQLALDFGSDVVVIPHVTDVEHAREVTGYAKFPPAGDRSMSGGRPFGYRWWTDDDLARLNERQLVLPLIEHPDGVRDIDAILALDSVDGFQMGPGDLALTSGRGMFKSTPADWADIDRCTEAVKRSGKTWLYPAWTERDRAYALRHEAPWILVGVQYLVFGEALRELAGVARAHAATASRSG